MACVLVVRWLGEGNGTHNAISSFFAIVLCFRDGLLVLGEAETLAPVPRDIHYLAWSERGKDAQLARALPAV